ncbi:hypothetical protein [Vulcanisaeta sp. EB80]|nr:hypothetical protein [Vulcanisaeta sp. EB80]
MYALVVLVFPWLLWYALFVINAVVVVCIGILWAYRFFSVTVAF